MKRDDWRQKSARAAIRAREKAELARLELELKHAQARRRRLMSEARAMCKRARVSLREKLKERRRLERERLRREAEAARLAERSSCKARRAIAKRSGAGGVARARAELVAARAAQKLASRQAARKLVVVPKVARIQESDEEARRDIPEELQGVWDRVRRNFKSGGRRSRAEAFLEWAEENPAEVIEIQSSDADRDVARLIQAHTAHRRKMGLRKTKAEIARELADVPF